MELNRFDLCSLDALSAARLLARGAPIPPCMTHHKASAEYIISCVSAGWFMIPMHKDGSYSQSQTEQLHRLTRAHPDLGPAMLRAQEAAALARQQFKGADFELFGSTSNQRLTSPVHMASNAHISPRMPLSFERGAFRADFGERDRAFR